MGNEGKDTKICKYCQTEISKKAKVCPQCRKKQGMGLLQKIGITILVLFLIAFLFGSSNEIDEDTLNNLEYVSEDTIDEVYSEPDKYQNKGIVLKGQVFGEPETTDSEIHFQMYADPENYERNTIVTFKFDEKISLKDGDYVVVDGGIVGSVTYENLLGGKVMAPQIQAVDVQVVDYISAVSPTEKTVEVNKTQEQFGYSVTVDKIEFSPIETRVYLTVNNNGGSAVSIYDFDMKIVQNGAQFTYQDNYNAEYDRLESGILSGVTDTAIVPFPVLEQAGNMQIYIDGYSDNWKEDIKTYVFDIAVE